MATYKPPQLNHTARLALLRFFNNPTLGLNLTKWERQNLIYSCLLTSQKFVDSFFNVGVEEANCYVCLNLEERIVISKEWRTYNFCLRELDFHHIAALISLSRLENIAISSWIWRVTNSIIRGWPLICRSLRRSKTLKAINMRIDIPRTSYNRFIFDLVPDKITILNADPDIAALLVHRETILESLSFFIQRKNLYYAQIFKIKTRKMEISYDFECGLWELANCGPFCPNPLIEKLKMRVFLGYYYKVDKVVECGEELMPKYKCALENLRQVNPNMELEFFDWIETGESKSIKEGIQKMEYTIKNTQQLIDISKEVGIKISSIYLKLNFQLIGVNHAHLAEQMTKKFDMHAEKDIGFVCYQVYGDTKIKLNHGLKLELLDSNIT